MDERPVMIDLQNVKKKYVIRHNFKKPDTLSGKLKLIGKRLLHPTYKYNTEDFYALDGITFKVHQGEKVGIIGKNGAGKSTLLKVLSRITEPTDGRIEMLGKVSAMLEVGTGFNMELTGRENVYLNGAILGMTKAEIDSKFDEIVEFSEVGRFIDTPVKRYSSGMFVRLAFAVASHLEPDILIVDEVLSVGDVKFQRKCITRMMNIAESGRTILYVSHQMQTIRQLCDRVIVLKDGKIVFDGDVEKGIEIYSDTVDTNLTKIDTSDHKPRGTQMVSIRGVEVKDREICAWRYDEPIKFFVKMRANEDCKMPKMEFVVRNLSTAEIYGKAESAPLGELEKGKDYEFEFTVRNENLLAPGKYMAGLEVWRTDGEIVTIDDIVVEVFTFEIMGEDDNDPSLKPIYWDSTMYGALMFPPMESEEIKD